MSEEGQGIPRTVAVIMDGNGRWATERGLERIEGHQAGEKAIVDTVRASSEIGLEALTLFAFSTENWKRPVEEVRFLMSFNENLLNRHVAEFHSRDIKIRFLGRRQGLPDSLWNKMQETIELTAGNSGMKLNVAFNYGGRAELTDAMRSIAEEVAKEKIRPSDVDENVVSEHLYAPDIPDYDLMIRTAGEMRISNYLLWELAYTEIYVTPVLWPDFRREHLFEAFEEYKRRIRKFGGLK